MVRATLHAARGLLWHDGQPVTSEDCIASIKRWASRTRLVRDMTFVDSIDAVDAKLSPSSSRNRRASCCLASRSLRRTCVHDAQTRRRDGSNKQIEDFTGSGPSSSSRMMEPGDKTVYVSSTSTSPRRAGSGLAAARSSRWTASSGALFRRAASSQRAAKGEIDYIEQPSPISWAPLKKDPNIAMSRCTNQGAVRLPPEPPAHAVRQPEVRQALWYAFNQETSDGDHR